MRLIPISFPFSVIIILALQPLNNQKADCFRLVLAGKKDFGMKDICHVLDTMEKYGADL